MDYWASIDKALDTIAETEPDTFDGVRDILHQYGDPEYPQPCTVTKRADHAFYAGSGGDKPVRVSLNVAGWVTVWSEASYYYVMMHRASGEFLSYVEGDVQRGVRSTVALAEFEAQAAADEFVPIRGERGELLGITLR